MSNQEPEKTTPTPSNLNWGDYLKQARQRLNMDIEVVAHQLKLPTKIVLMMEQGKLLEPPTSSVFIKGYIRQYAQLVDIDAEPLIHLINKQLAERPKKNKSSMLKHKKTYFLPHSFLPALAGFIFLLVIWFFAHDLFSLQGKKNLDEHLNIAEHAITKQFNQDRSQNELDPEVNQRLPSSSTSSQTIKAPEPIGSTHG